MSVSIGKKIFQKNNTYNTVRCYERLNIKWYFVCVDSGLIYVGWITANAFIQNVAKSRDVQIHHYSVEYIESFSGRWIESQLGCYKLQVALDIVNKYYIAGTIPR